VKAQGQAVQTPYVYHRGLGSIIEPSGIDMVKLGTREYRVKTLKGWGISGGNKVGEELECYGTTGDGMRLEGAGYFLNRSMKDGQPHKCTWDVNKHGLFIQVNPSALTHKWKLTADPTPAVEAIKHDMELLGIELAVESLVLNQVDLSRQAVMPDPIPFYHPTLSALQGTRMKKTDYPSGVSFSNTQKQVVFYDKTEQVVKVKQVTDIPSNMLRCEARWKKSRVISNDRNGLGLYSFADLLRTSSAELDRRYKGLLNSAVFKPSEGVQLSFDFDGMVESLRTYMGIYEKGGWRHYIGAAGIQQRIDEAGSFDNLIQLIGTEYSRAQTKKIAAQLRHDMQTEEKLQSRKRTDGLSSSIELLHRTFAA